MGNIASHVSIEGCKAHYNVTLDCTVTENPKSYGGVLKGDLEGDPDISGIGIVSVFIAVSGFALATSFIAAIWQTIKCYRRSIWSFTEERKKNRTSVSEILETLVLSCSDQQLFTGAAYALAVRYWRGCTLSAYHYNVVANGLLITLATHLLAMTVVINYWKYPFLAIIRAFLTFGVFWVAGLMLARRHAEVGDGAFPIKIPGPESSSDNMFLAAACFQKDENADQFGDALRASLGSAGSAFGWENQGWNVWFLMMVWWSFAIIAELMRFLRRGQKKSGWRRKIIHRTRTWADQTGPDAQSSKFSIKKIDWRLVGSRFFKFMFLFYLYAGLIISAVVVIASGKYIKDLRSWVHATDWLEKGPSGHSEEQEATSLGQLIPIFLSSLTVFAFLQAINEKLSSHRRRKHEREEAAEEDNQALLKNTEYTSPSVKSFAMGDMAPPKSTGNSRSTWAGGSPSYPYQSGTSSPNTLRHFGSAATLYDPNLPPRPAPTRTWTDSSSSNHPTPYSNSGGASWSGTWQQPVGIGHSNNANNNPAQTWGYSPLNGG